MGGAGVGGEEADDLGRESDVEGTGDTQEDSVIETGAPYRGFGPIGFARAKEYLMTGRLMTGAEAAAIGLVNHAVSREHIDVEVQKMSDRLANGASKAIRWTKVSVNIGLKQLAHSIMDTSLAYEALSNLSKDHQEAVTAFRENRRPEFTGE